jgi:hypothetical protein
MGRETETASRCGAKRVQQNARPATCRSSLIRRPPTQARFGGGLLRRQLEPTGFAEANVTKELDSGPEHRRHEDAKKVSI